ncbi:MAG: MarR family winged helix-turn-helix transcriptional regulator [Oscillospiraceae bacterium]|nr:MarR family winged helix-turn-helix transcriptional regulator [Oscillospiraceae bacterium]
MDNRNELCQKIREFNRFYTVQMGFLNSGYLGSSYSITETRILFELKTHAECTQSDIVKKLHIDKSYLSRIIKKFAQKGLVEKSKFDGDKRAEILSLTALGNSETDHLIELANERISSQISSLNSEDCDILFSSLETILTVYGRSGC